MVSLYLAFPLLWRTQRWLLALALTWALSALALWLLARMHPGVQVKSLGAAFSAAALILLVNAAVGPVFRFFFFPLTALTLGLFLVVINALLLKLASLFTPGLKLRGVAAPILGALALSAVKVAVGLLLPAFTLGRW